MELILRNKFIKKVSKLPKEIQDTVNKDLIILGESDSLESSGLECNQIRLVEQCIQLNIVLMCIIN
jgi:hypothetical protein